MNDERVLAEVHASGPRRVIGVGMQVLLGGLLLWVALAAPPQSTGWQVFLLVIGVLALWLGQRMWQATQTHLILTPTALRDSTGAEVARIAEIDGVERGMFAFKPSNGFVLKMKRPQARSWRPGLWWRLGRRVAVGGVTPGSQTKPMADVIAALVAGHGPDLTE